MDWGNLLSGVADLGMAGYSIYSGQQSANLANRQYSHFEDIAKDQHKWAEEDRERYEELYHPLEDKLVEANLEDFDKNLEYQRALRDDYLHNATAYRGIEDAMIADAEAGIDPEHYVGQAVGDINQAFDKTGAATARAMSRYGINPNSGRFTGATRENETSRALATAGATTQAHRLAEDTNRNLRTTALNYKKGSPMPTFQTANGSQLLNSATANMNSAADKIGGLASTAANAAGQSYSAAGYALGRGTNPVSQGGVDWNKAVQDISGMFN